MKLELDQVTFSDASVCDRLLGSSPECFLWLSPVVRLLSDISLLSFPSPHLQLITAAGEPGSTGGVFLLNVAVVSL